MAVHDVVQYILSQTGPIPAMKLQKLIYYCQAWSLVWEDRPLFRDEIEAWVNGPVVPRLYKLHRGLFEVSDWPHGDASHLNEADRSTIDAVLKFYGGKTSQWLSDLTHQEKPWVEARKGLSLMERGSQKITMASMLEYYSALP